MQLKYVSRKNEPDVNNEEGHSQSARYTTGGRLVHMSTWCAITGNIIHF
jgi:hypothetical protein